MSYRPLSQGEINLCIPIFNNSIDYSRVKIHNGQYWWFFGLQDPDTAVAPNGEIFFPSKLYQDDFSQMGGSDQAFFMHEMVHVWQYQMGYGVISRRIKFWNPPSYTYTLDHAKTFAHYNMEAQGNLLCDYFALTVLGAPEIIREQAHANDLPLYQQVLKDFLINPGDKAWLPLPDL